MEDKKHKHGFNTPKDYFKNFDDRLFSKLSEGYIPKKDGFTVPEGYFNLFEETVLNRVKNIKEQPKVIPILSRKTITYAISIAACAVLVFSIINTNASKITLDNLQFTTIESYIEDGNLSFDSYDVALLLNDEDLENLFFDEEIFSEETLEKYLLENIDDTTLLLE